MSPLVCSETLAMVLSRREVKKSCCRHLCRVRITAHNFISQRGGQGVSEAGDSTCMACKRLQTGCQKLQVLAFNVMSVCSFDVFQVRQFHCNHRRADLRQVRVLAHDVRNRHKRGSLLRRTGCPGSSRDFRRATMRTCCATGIDWNGMLVCYKRKTSVQNRRNFAGQGLGEECCTC